MELIKRDSVVVLMSTALGIFIITVLSFFIVWIGFPADTPQNSFKDALGFAGGLFGGLATFGAAIIAAHLFNDWKIVHSTESDTQDAKNLQNTIFAIKGLLDSQLNFILLYSGMGFDDNFKKQANMNLEILQEKYLSLKMDFNIQISIFSINALNRDTIFNNSEEQIFDHYFYTITTLLTTISLGKHISNEYYFKSVLNHCRTCEKVIFDDLLNRINEQLIKKIKPQ